MRAFNLTVLKFSFLECDMFCDFSEDILVIDSVASAALYLILKLEKHLRGEHRAYDLRLTLPHETQFLGAEETQ